MLISHLRFTTIAAALCALAPLGSQAQVTISGAMDLSVEAVNTGDPGGKARQVSSGTVTSSRIVFSGREDLGGGMTAFFRLDMGLQGDTGATLPGANINFGRTSIVGIEDRRWGQVALGRTGTPLIPMLNQTDFGGIGYYGNNGSISQNLIGRASNGIYYTSPDMGGLTLRAVATLGLENPTPPKDQGRLLGLGAYYRAGKLNLAAAYQTSKERTATGTNLAVDDQTEAGLGGRYDFGWATVNAGWYRIHQVTPAASRDRAIPSNNTTSYWVGAVVPVGPQGKRGLQVGQTKGDLKAAGLPEPKGTTWATYYAHSLSKRSTLYVNYARVDNNAGSKLSLIPAAYNMRLRPAVNGSDPSALAAGIVHLF
ncbi:MAG: porin [Rubrivivax sp.]